MPTKETSAPVVPFQAYKAAIHTALEEFFTEIPGLLHFELSAASQDVLEKLREYSLRPSKRIRGSLACFAYDYVTKQTHGAAGTQAAVALELMQNYLLIVDDVMDRSDVRRGQPTVHQIYFGQQPEAEKDLHMANMLAVNVGLIAQHLLNIVLAQITEDPARVQQAFLYMHRNITATGFGQVDDAVQQVGLSFSEADIVHKYKMKSSYYTFVNPLQVGLILGGESRQQVLQEVEDFGVAAGIAFQLYDDLLGVFGKPGATGKPNTDDVEEGKYTLLVQYALDYADAADKAYLLEVLGQPGATPEIMTRVQEILKKCGAHEYVVMQITKYVDEAHKIMRQSSFWDTTAKDAMIDMLYYAVGKKKAS